MKLKINLLLLLHTKQKYWLFEISRSGVMETSRVKDIRSDAVHLYNYMTLVIIKWNCCVT